MLIRKMFISASSSVLKKIEAIRIAYSSSFGWRKMENWYFAFEERSAMVQRIFLFFFLHAGVRKLRFPWGRSESDQAITMWKKCNARDTGESMTCRGRSREARRASPSGMVRRFARGACGSGTYGPTWSRDARYKFAEPIRCATCTAVRQRNGNFLREFRRIHLRARVSFGLLRFAADTLAANISETRWILMWNESK